jgi:long-chain acyl-CoA synthetase
MLLSSQIHAAAPPPARGGRSLLRHPTPRPLVVARVASRRRRTAGGSFEPPAPKPAAAPPPPPSYSEDDQGARRGALEEIYRRSSESTADAETDADLLLPDLWPRLASLYGDTLVALEDPRAVVVDDEDDDDKRGLSLTYAQLEREIALFARGLAKLGLPQGERAALFADGSPRWLVADQAVMRLGCADAVRGASSPAEELAFIAAHSRSVGLIFQDSAAFLRAAPALLRARTVPFADTRPPPLSAPKFVVLLWGDKGSEEVRAAAAALGVPPHALLTYRELTALGDETTTDPLTSVPLITSSDLATIVYTSGTTGAQPKGCPLTHGNLAYQLKTLPPRIGVQPGDVSLALLPPWHVYARVAQYLVLASGGKERYSSARHLKEDLASEQPAFLVAVPLLLEALHARALARVAAQRPWFRAAVAQSLIAASEAFVVWRRRARGVDVDGDGSAAAPSSSFSLLLLRRAAALFVATVLFPLHALARLLVWKKVREGLGVTKAVVSGGASLPPHLDAFFEASGIELTSGYGLTETSPVLACRASVGAASKVGVATEEEPNVRGTVGRPLPGTELRVVDPETLRRLADGERGLVLARGPGVFQGYLDDDEATAAAFPRLPDGDEEEGGWFNTGDLGSIVPASAGAATAGCLVLSGRAKDTIVLLSGENVEPEPIEGALVVSSLVKHAIVIGQDRRELGVLVFPSEEAEEKRRRAAAGASATASLEREIAAEAARLNASRPGYESWERLARVEVAWGAALSPDDGTLTRTFKVRRAAALERHKERYERLMGGLRG